MDILLFVMMLLTSVLITVSIIIQIKLIKQTKEEIKVIVKELFESWRQTGKHRGRKQVYKRFDFDSGFRKVDDEKK